MSRLLQHDELILLLGIVEQDLSLVLKEAEGGTDVEKEKTYKIFEQIDQVRILVVNVYYIEPIAQQILFWDTKFLRQKEKLLCDNNDIKLLKSSLEALQKNIVSGKALSVKEADSMLQSKCCGGLLGDTRDLNWARSRDV